MRVDNGVARRSVILGSLGVAAGTVGALPAAGAPGGAPAAGGASAPRPGLARVPLWQEAWRRGIVFGTAMSTRLEPDTAYSDLVDTHAAVLLTEDDLLWYKLKPTPESELDFSYGDQLVAYAGGQRQLVFAAHLVWDEGFGEGWTDDDLWGLSEPEARELLFGTAQAMAEHYRGQVAGWIVANEVTDPEGVNGVRTNVPWYEPLGPAYVSEPFHIAHEADPHADLVLNEFGFETVNEWGDQPADRQRATLQVIDELLADDVPVHAVGVQAHLLADRFAERFDPRSYRRFLADIADRGLKIFITELDVLDDGLPADVHVRDRAIADIYRRYLDVALDEPAVTALMTFGLSDRYTWLQEDYPREDGAARRPLPFDDDLAPKRAFAAVRHSLRHAPMRSGAWDILR